MSILDTIDEAVAMMERAVAVLPKVSANQIGLDVRAGWVYVDVENQLIVVDHNSVRSLNYYGGFEYVDSEQVTTMGDYTVYQSEDEDDRVGDAVRYYEMNYADEI